MPILGLSTWSGDDCPKVYKALWVKVVFEWKSFCGRPFIQVTFIFLRSANITWHSWLSVRSRPLTRFAPFSWQGIGAEDHTCLTRPLAYVAWDARHKARTLPDASQEVHAATRPSCRTLMPSYARQWRRPRTCPRDVPSMTSPSYLFPSNPPCSNAQPGTTCPTPSVDGASRNTTLMSTEDLTSRAKKENANPASFSPDSPEKTQRRRPSSSQIYLMSQLRELVNQLWKPSNNAVCHYSKISPV